MKKTFKAFTLIELIIVMAILAILMAAIMNMMKPIRSTYVDATLYESQRTTQNGIIRYVGESVRYATNLGVYNESVSGITDATDAIAKFKVAAKKKDGSAYTDDEINIITIDNSSNFLYQNANYRGRIVRSKQLAAGGTYTNNVSVAGSTEARLALGSAYYGDSNYSINIVPDGSNLKISVASVVANSLGERGKARGVKTEDIATSANKFVVTEGYIACQNLGISGHVLDSTYAGTSTTTQGKNTYIVYTLPEKH